MRLPPKRYSREPLRRGKYETYENINSDEPKKIYISDTFGHVHVHAAAPSTLKWLCEPVL